MLEGGGGQEGTCIKRCLEGSGGMSFKKNLGF